MMQIIDAGLSCPIDQRPLPGLDGQRLEQFEAWRTWGAFNDAFADYAIGHPDASLAECEAIARRAAAEELRRLLKDRPAAPRLKTSSTSRPGSSIEA
ncbi:hypothetical protein [Singulisphaera sp. PoT]|uniref:hypothetical protein n=1 Tax=Singulisphaera sp. PoT TaxID=3411797 RepID=UPI003BF55992